MSQLRILQLNSMLLGGGTDDQCEKLSRALLELNQDVQVFGPEEREYSAVLKSSHIPLCGAPEGKLQFISAAAGQIKKFRPSIVHAHHGRDIWPCVIASRISGVRPKVVLTRHMAKSPSSWASRNFLLRNCEALIAVSQFVAKVLKEGVIEPLSEEEERRRRPPISGDFSKIHVIYGGIDTNRFRPKDASELRKAWGLRESDYAFGIVGGFYAPGGKGQNQFLEAAAVVRRQLPNARFLLIGRGNLVTELNKKIVDLGLSGKAWLPGYCREMDLGMNALDCLVHPAVGTEALGLVLCEAMACGRPVIASDLDGIPEAVQFGGLGTLVTPRSVEELAKAMIDWGRRPKPTENERALTHARIEKFFSYQEMGEKTLSLYNGLLRA